MDEYIKKSEAVDVIVKYPYDIAGKTATAIKMIENLPSADVVPKSEVEILKSLITHKEEEAYNKGYNDALKDIVEMITKNVSERGK